MNPLRILELTWEYPPHIEGGLGSHVGALAPALAAQNARVCVVTPRLSGGDLLERTPNLTVTRVETTSPAGDLVENVHHINQELLAAVRVLLASGGQFDVIHAHDWLVGDAAIALKHMLRVPLVVTIHATELGRNRGFVQNGLSEAISRAEWELSYESWRTITVSHAMAVELAGFFALPPDKIDVIPNGIDIARYDAIRKEDPHTLRRRFAADDEPLVLYIGRMVYEKGAHVLVEAAPAILSRFPKTRFVLGGRGVMLETLRRRADQIGIRDRCVFTGFIPDAVRDGLYSAANCAVFPSLYEPFGIVALEAMAAGCPVVVSDVGGLAEVVQDGKSGLVVPPMSVDRLASAIAETLGVPQEALRRANAALEYVRLEHSWTRIAATTLAVFERVARERAAVNWQAG